MNVFGIDPGTTHSAWVLFDGVRVLNHGKDRNEVLLTALRQRASVIDPDGNVLVVIEMVQSFGMSVGAEVFETVYWIGRFCGVWDGGRKTGEREAERLFRITIKNHLCHSSRAKDGNIRQALIDRLGKPGTKKNPGPTHGISGDCWSALAVAVTAWDTLR